MLLYFFLYSGNATTDSSYRFSDENNIYSFEYDFNRTKLNQNGKKK